MLASASIAVEHRGFAAVGVASQGDTQGMAVVAVLRMLGLKDDDARVNAWGGAIALGHPLGATGAIRAATLMSAMQRGQARYGMISMCIGTGMGAAGVFERV